MGKQLASTTYLLLRRARARFPHLFLPFVPQRCNDPASIFSNKTLLLALRSPLINVDRSLYDEPCLSAPLFCFVPDAVLGVAVLRARAIRMSQRLSTVVRKWVDGSLPQSLLRGTLWRRIGSIVWRVAGRQLPQRSALKINEHIHVANTLSFTQFNAWEDLKKVKEKCFNTIYIGMGKTSCSQRPGRLQT